ncbi:MAG: FAD-binding protein [Clostridiales bacterium]|nr:FAD-binding protein [Clostridiales bacterium]
MYDVTIIGAGPAGANLARLIGDRYKVLLIDKRAPGNGADPRPDSKCCGGLLAPDAQAMIARLGLGIPKEVLVDPQLFAVRTIDLDNSLERLYQRFYFNMDRGKFERWLISTLPEAVEQRFGCVFQDYTEIAYGYEIRYTRGEEKFSAETKVLVGADGACSKVRRSLFGDKGAPEKYIAIQEWFECKSPMPYFTAIFDHDITDFYAWVIPKDGQILFGAALRPGKDASEKFERLKEKLTCLGFCFDNRARTEGAYIYRPTRASRFSPGQDNIALIGEASGAISPSSAEGISYALRTSLHLAESLEKGLSGFLSRYSKKTRKVRFNLLLKNLKSPAMYVPILRRFAMKSGLKSIR